MCSGHLRTLGVEDIVPVLIIMMKVLLLLISIGRWRSAILVPVPAGICSHQASQVVSKIHAREVEWWRRIFCMKSTVVGCIEVVRCEALLFEMRSRAAVRSSCEERHPGEREKGPKINTKKRSN
jgi:hypothetical protein